MSEEIIQNDRVIRRTYALPVSILLSALIMGSALVYNAGVGAKTSGVGDDAGVSGIEDVVMPPDGVTLPILWGDLGARMAESGVIDKEQFEELYRGRGSLTPEMRNLVSGTLREKLVITEGNAGALLNFLWAFGLGNKNRILEEGPMSDSRYGGAGGFASTGGWTLAKGDAMDHYSRHEFVTLTAAEQELVERVSKGIYRPCCNNATYFPDCNHGMAMLGLLELMASQGASEKEMYETALRVNSYWFPDTYLSIAEYLGNQGIAWDTIDPKEILGVQYSSASGYGQVLRHVEEKRENGGSSCGVEEPAAPRKQSGCGV